MPNTQMHQADNQEEITQILDKVLSTGVPVEIERKGKRLLISPAKKHRELDCLEEHPECMVGNPDDLVHMDWSSEWSPKL